MFRFLKFIVENIFKVELTENRIGKDWITLSIKTRG